MKKIISLLVALAMVMALVPVAFAATESGGFMLEGGTDYTWTPEYSGTATLSGDPSVNIAVNGGNTAMGYNPSFEVVAGQDYTVRHFGTGFAWITWEIATAAGDSDATSGTVIVESYSSGDFTAPKDGTVQLTLDVVSTMDIIIGYTPYQLGLENGGTIEVTAGTTYSIYAPGATTDATVTWEYVTGGSNPGGNPGGNQPAGTTLALGSNVLAIDALDPDGETYTFTATEAGELSVEITGFAYDEGFGFGMQEVPVQYLAMVFGRNFLLEINGVQVYDFSAPATLTVAAGDEVAIIFASPRMRYAAELTINLSLEANQGGGTAAEGSAGNPYIIDSIPTTLTGTLTEETCFDGLFYQYTATEAGTISCSDNGPIVSATLNGEPASLPVDVVAGDVLVLNPWAMAPGDFAIDVVWGAPLAGEPDGSMGNPFVITELPWTYTAEGGYHDIYANYTAAEACTLKITYPEGNYVSGIISFDKFDEQNYYLVYVDAGEVVSINPWGNADGTYVVSLYDGQGGGGNDDGGNQGGITGETIPVHSGVESVAADQTVEILFTPDADGVLTIDIYADPGYRLEVQNVATMDTIGLREESSQPQTLTYDLVAGVEYKILINGFSTATWDVAAATIAYQVSYTSGTGGVMEDLAESTVDLVVGEQNVELLPNAITTLYNFYAPEAGIYTVTIPNDAIAELYSVAWTSYQICEGNTLVFTATADEQGFLIGLTSEADSMNVKIEKTGSYTPPATTTYLNYEATVEFDDEFKMPEVDMTNVDITVAQTVVLGTDGYYHLGTADGPVLYVNLNSDGFTLATLMSAGAPITMRGEKFEGQDGKLYCYDYMNLIAFGDYQSYSQEYDYYPLNADLMAFFQDYGAAQGWYDAEFSNFDAIKAGNFNAESAWMVALAYVKDATDNNQGGNTGNQGGNTGNQGGNTGNQGGTTGNQGGTTGGNATTGDFGVIAAAVALGMSAICGTAVIAKKKEN